MSFEERVTRVRGLNARSIFSTTKRFILYRHRARPLLKQPVRLLQLHTQQVYTAALLVRLEELDVCPHAVRFVVYPASVAIPVS